MVGDAKAARPQHPQRMRLVDHQPRAMAPRDGDKGRQIGDVAIHAVMAFDDQERMPGAPARLAEQPVSGLVVEMGERRPARPGQRRPLDDAVVDQRIMNDDVVAPEQTPDDA